MVERDDGCKKGDSAEGSRSSVWALSILLNSVALIFLQREVSSALRMSQRAGDVDVFYERFVVIAGVPSMKRSDGVSRAKMQGGERSRIANC
jgi:hypothetical protein